MLKLNESFSPSHQRLRRIKRPLKTQTLDQIPVVRSYKAENVSSIRVEEMKDQSGVEGVKCQGAYLTCMDQEINGVRKPINGIDEQSFKEMYATGALKQGRGRRDG